MSIKRYRFHDEDAVTEPSHLIVEREREYVLSSDHEAAIGECRAEVARLEAELAEAKRSRDEARAMTDVAKQAQYVAENDAAMVRAVWNNVEPALKAENERLRNDLASLRTLVAEREPMNPTLPTWLVLEWIDACIKATPMTSWIPRAALRGKEGEK